MNIADILACPSCKGPLLSSRENGYECKSCGAGFQSQDGVTVFLRPDSKIIADEADRAEFWNKGWEKRNAHLLTLDREAIVRERQNSMDYLSKQAYPSVVDITPEKVGGKLFLNIGCGGGYEGLLFAGYGARYIGVDFSHNAASFTKKLIHNAGFGGVTYQAEAEALPFQSDSIDFIYSSGVLHHTPNTEQALKEVHRVLKPGGTAMIGLYPTYSIMFLWYRLHAVLRGNFSKRAIDDWMNANTEGDWQVEDSENKWTKTYTKPQFAALMDGAGFTTGKIQQTPEQIKTIPIIGKIVTALFPQSVGDIRIGPFGGMLVATSSKGKTETT